MFEVTPRGLLVTFSAANGRRAIELARRLHLSGANRSQIETDRPVQAAERTRL